MNAKTVVMIVSGIEIALCGIGAVLCYGKAQYYQGRIDMANEIKTGVKEEINKHKTPQ